MSISQISCEGLVTINVGKLGDQFRVIQTVLSGHDTAISVMKSSKDDIDEVKRICARLSDDVMKSKAVVSQFEKMGADLKKFVAISEQNQQDLTASQKMLEGKLLQVAVASEEAGNAVSGVKEEVQQVKSDISKIASFSFDVSPSEMEELGVPTAPKTNVDFFLSQLLLIFLTTNKLKSFAISLQSALVESDRNIQAVKVVADEANLNILSLRASVDALRNDQDALHQEQLRLVEETYDRKVVDEKLKFMSDSFSSEFKSVETKIESLRGFCSNESVVRHLVSAIENTNVDLKAQQDSQKVFIENMRTEMLALHSKVAGLLKEKDKPDVPPTRTFTTTIATMPAELEAMRYSMEQTRKEMINITGKQRRVEELLGQKADMSYTNSLVRQIVGEFTDKTQSLDVRELENATHTRQALSKLHESVKEKVNRSELKLLRDTLEKTRNMEIKSLDPKHSKAGDDASLGDLFDRPDLEQQLRGIFKSDGSKRSSRPKSAIGYNSKFDRQGETESNSKLVDTDSNTNGDSVSFPTLQESMVLVETPLIGKDGRQYIGAPRPLSQLSSKSLSTPLLLSPELPVRFLGNVSGKGAMSKRVSGGADLPVVTGKTAAVPLIPNIPSVQMGASIGR